MYSFVFRQTRNAKNTVAKFKTQVTDEKLHAAHKYIQLSNHYYLQLLLVKLLIRQHTCINIVFLKLGMFLLCVLRVCFIVHSHRPQIAFGQVEIDNFCWRGQFLSAVKVLSRGASYSPAQRPLQWSSTAMT